MLIQFWLHWLIHPHQPLLVDKFGGSPVHQCITTVSLGTHSFRKYEQNNAYTLLNQVL